MEYGILVVTADDMYQIIGAVWTVNEARELAENYIRAAIANSEKPAEDGGCSFIPPENFEIHRRDSDGWYTTREPLEVE